LGRCGFWGAEVGQEDRLCQFFSGVIRGAADEDTGKTQRVVETECTAAGSDRCEFYMERIDSQEFERY